jgi:hypothetical protein
LQYGRRCKNVETVFDIILKKSGVGTGCARIKQRHKESNAGFDGGSMTHPALIWAAVPHNSDGVVFQARILHGLQRFYVSRRVLEEVFGLERKAPDARQLQVFYAHLPDILSHARDKRSIGGSDTVTLLAVDFPSGGKSSRDARPEVNARRLQ